MTPPAAEELVPRLFLGPALRAQSDRRLVGLVRDGYEAAFDEIVHRYGGPLRRYAGTIVGGRAEDVTQDAFSKALQALRRDEREIELRPWLYRIVRNTALNDLRDRPPSALALAETIEGHRGVAEEVELREEVAELLERLRALPEAQRAAIVMRELEGLGHDEIASALGISGGAARQAIHRARTALRNGLGMAIPLPLLKLMLEGGGTPSAEIAAGGAGAGVVLKAATATVLVAGTFGAGVALHEGSRGEKPQRSAGASRQSNRSASPSTLASTAHTTRQAGLGHGGSGEGNRASQSGGPGRFGKRGGSEGHDSGSGRGTSGKHGSTPNSTDGGSHSGSSPLETSGHGSGGSQQGPPSDGGRSGPGDGSLSGGGGSGDGGSSSGSDGGGGSSDGGSGSGDLSRSGDGSGSNSGPGSGDSGQAGEETSSSGSGDSRDSQSVEGFSVQMEPQPQED